MSNIDVFVFQRYEFGSGLMFFFPLVPWEDAWMNEISDIPHVLSIKQHNEGFMQVYAAPVPEDMFLSYGRMLASNISRICGGNFTVEKIIEPDYDFTDKDLEEEDARERAAEEKQLDTPRTAPAAAEPAQQAAPAAPTVARSDPNNTNTFVFRVEDGKVRHVT